MPRSRFEWRWRIRPTPGTAHISFLLCVTSQLTIVFWRRNRLCPLPREGYNRQTLEIWWRNSSTIYSSECSRSQPTTNGRCKEILWDYSFCIPLKYILTKICITILINTCKSNIVFFNRMELRQQIQRICVVCVVNPVQLRVQ